MTVESIKEAIAELSVEEKTSLTAWLVEQDAAEWDRQMEEDFSPGGAGIALLEEARTDLQSPGQVEGLNRRSLISRR